MVLWPFCMAAATWGLSLVRLLVDSAVLGGPVNGDCAVENGALAFCVGAVTWCCLWLETFASTVDSAVLGGPGKGGCAEGSRAQLSVHAVVDGLPKG